MPSEGVHVSTGRAARVSAILFIAFFCLFALLRSNDIFAVDGAHRCLVVYHQQTLSVHHTNHHILYPVNVLVWTRLAAVLGWRPDGPLEFFSTVELMNCLAGAACLAIFCFLMLSVLPSWGIALGTTGGIGLSRAFFEQATNANEPVVGVFWSLLALLFAASSFKLKSNWPIFASGILFSLAMATYQSAILLAPAAIILILYSRSKERMRMLPDRTQWVAIGTLALGGLIGGLAIYGWAYRLEGIKTPLAMLRYFFVQEDAHADIGWSVGKSMNVPIGMVRNIFPVLQEYTGIRNLLRGPKPTLTLFLLVLCSFSGFLVFCFVQLWRRRDSLSRPVRIALLSAGVGLVFTIIPAVIYNPNYDKMWLMPLICVACLIAISLQVSSEHKGSVSLFAHRGSAILLLCLLSNTGLALASHRHKTQGLLAAEQVAARVGKQDFVVGGWDNVSVLFADLWANEGQYMDFTMEASVSGRNATTELHDAVLKALKNGGRVYFLGVVDLPEQTWNSYLGPSCGVPFSDLDIYRVHSNMIETFIVDRRRVSLWQLDPASVD